MEQCPYANEPLAGLCQRLSDDHRQSRIPQLRRGIFSSRRYSADSLFNLQGSAQRRQLCWHICLPTSLGNSATASDDSDTERYSVLPTTATPRPTPTPTATVKATPYPTPKAKPPPATSPAPTPKLPLTAHAHANTGTDCVERIRVFRSQAPFRFAHVEWRARNSR
jgi:hypothetical protein